MGQKVDPYIVRLGVNKTWTHFWSTEKKNYARNTQICLAVEKIWKKHIASNLYEDLSVKITPKEVIISVFTHRPSVLIGQKGANINESQQKVYKDLMKMIPSLKDEKIKINIKIKEIMPGTSPAYICEQISEALIARRNYKNLIKYCATTAMQAGCLGMKIKISGRINGVDIARTVSKSFGSIASTTLTANIYSFSKHVFTKSGCCGVKCIMALAS